MPANACDMPYGAWSDALQGAGAFDDPRVLAATTAVLGSVSQKELHDLERYRPRGPTRCSTRRCPAVVEQWWLKVAGTDRSSGLLPGALIAAPPDERFLVDARRHLSYRGTESFRLERVIYTLTGDSYTRGTRPLIAVRIS